MGLRSTLNRIIQWSSLATGSAPAGSVPPVRLAGAAAVSSGADGQVRLAAVPGHVPGMPAGVPYSVMLLDRSPSMQTEDWQPNRLEGAKEAMLAHIRRLARHQPLAQVAIIVFCGEVHTLCSFHQAEDWQHFSAELARVDTSLATNIGDALLVAHRMLAGISGPRHVLLLTDGDHNYGPAPLPPAISLKTIARVETIGVGRRTNINEALLRAIASANPDGSAAYRWIGSKQILVAHMEQAADRICRR